MRNKPLYIARLMTLFLQDNLSENEKIEFQEWLDSDPENQKLLDRFAVGGQQEEDIQRLHYFDAERAWEDNKRRRGDEKKTPVSKINLPIAAAVILIALLGVWMMEYFFVQESVPLANVENTIEDVDPAINGANLILADGSVYVVESDQLNISNNTIYLDQNREDRLADVGSIQNAEMVYNTLEVPEAKYFKIQLSDGTLVWINSMSSLRFPSDFSGAERRVYLEGEAYFDVAHNASTPFVVETGGTDVKVLGTKFNVDAYMQEVRTTLKEGSVSVQNGVAELILKPGEYAFSKSDKLIKGEADLEYDLAWVNDEFLFRNDNISTIATQISRWYGVQVKFRGEIDVSKRYTGTVSRKAKLSETMEMLEFVSDLSFKLENNELIVTKK